MHKLLANVTALRAALAAEGFDLGGSRTQILPLVIGEPQQAMKICETALAQGVFAQAIRPPTVPPMTSRLRLAVMATHHEEELRAAARTLGAAARATGFEPRSRIAPVIARPEPEPVPQAGGVFDFEAPGPVRRAA